MKSAIEELETKGRGAAIYGLEGVREALLFKEVLSLAR